MTGTPVRGPRRRERGPVSRSPCARCADEATVSGGAGVGGRPETGSGGEALDPDRGRGQEGLEKMPIAVERPTFVYTDGSGEEFTPVGIVGICYAAVTPEVLPAFAGRVRGACAAAGRRG